MVSEDAWLARHLGRPVYHLLPDAAAGPAARDRALETLRTRAPVFCDAKVDTADVATVAGLEEAGMRLVDTLITFAGPHPAPAAADVRVREAGPADAAAVRALAARALDRSRFNLDPRVPPATAAAIKADWAGNYFAGTRGDAMLVADDGAGGVAGFLLAIVRPPVAVVDLVCVDAGWRRRGVGRTLMARLGPATGTDTVRVGTQVANLPSLALYARCGLTVVETRYVLHGWFD
jgi:ribosomal protein S18 acetylase RimI-like enzyme